MLYGTQLRSYKFIKISVIEMRILQWISGDTRKYRIQMRKST